MDRESAEAVLDRLSEKFPAGTVKLVGFPVHGERVERDWGVKLDLPHGLPLDRAAIIPNALKGSGYSRVSSNVMAGAGGGVEVHVR